MIVVIEVTPTGKKLTRTASAIASLLVMPLRMAVRSAIRMCMESAIASVRMMIGAEPEMGVSLMPIKPAQPMPTIEENMITNSVAKAAVADRRINKVSNMMMPNIAGTRVPRSAVPVSANALLSIDTPVNETSMFGWAASI